MSCGESFLDRFVPMVFKELLSPLLHGQFPLNFFLKLFLLPQFLLLSIPLSINLLLDNTLRQICYSSVSGFIVVLKNFHMVYFLYFFQERYFSSFRLHLLPS